MKNKPKLDHWVQFHGNVLVGYIANSPEFKNGQRVHTSYVKKLDLNKKEVICIGEEYTLGRPGTLEEHDIPLIRGVWKKPILEMVSDYFYDLFN